MVMQAAVETHHSASGLLDLSRSPLLPIPLRLAEDLAIRVAAENRK